MRAFVFPGQGAQAIGMGQALAQAFPAAAAVFAEVAQFKEELVGYRVAEAPAVLRHFTARLVPDPLPDLPAQAAE